MDLSDMTKQIIHLMNKYETKQIFLLCTSLVGMQRFVLGIILCILSKTFNFFCNLPIEYFSSRAVEYPSGPQQT